jgi:hypothetical protein
MAPSTLPKPAPNRSAPATTRPLTDKTPGVMDKTRTPPVPAPMNYSPGFLERTRVARPTSGRVLSTQGMFIPRAKPARLVAGAADANLALVREASFAADHARDFCRQKSRFATKVACCDPGSSIQHLSPFVTRHSSFRPSTTALTRIDHDDTTSTTGSEEESRFPDAITCLRGRRRRSARRNSSDFLGVIPPPQRLLYSHPFFVVSVVSSWFNPAQ